MTTLPIAQTLVTVEEYLEGESRSEVKHEYLGGVVYAMAGASEPHNIIAMNLYGALHSRLRGKPCQPFGSDMKVKLLPLGDTYFYYPDAMVACDPTDAGHGWRERPAVLFEIISEDTRRIDEREKRLAYLQLASLTAYVRIEQDRPEAVAEHRTHDGWKIERLTELGAVIHVPAIDIELPLAELYERLSF
jgi:Uma2 family endonuclease